MGNITIRMNDDLKARVNQTLDAIGMNFNTYVTMASIQLVNQQRLLSTLPCVPRNQTSRPSAPCSQPHPRTGTGTAVSGPCSNPSFGEGSPPDYGRGRSDDTCPRRRRYGSYEGETTPIPDNPVDRVLDRWRPSWLELMDHCGLTWSRGAKDCSPGSMAA